MRCTSPSIRNNKEHLQENQSSIAFETITVAFAAVSLDFCKKTLNEKVVSSRQVEKRILFYFEKEQPTANKSLVASIVLNVAITHLWCCHSNGIGKFQSNMS